MGPLFTALRQLRRGELPQWCTEARLQELLDLFQRSGGFCVQGHKMCQDSSHHYVNVVEAKIEAWKGDDRLLWKLSQRQLHGEVGQWKRRFDPVQRDVFLYEQQPNFYLLGLGVNPFNFRENTALVRVPSSIVHLFVEIGRLPSKSARRKAARYGKLPQRLKQSVDELCAEAVRDARVSQKV